MNRMLVAKKLVALRGEMKAADVAKACGISVSALKMYESGQRIPRDEIKIALAKLYGLSVEAIFFTT